MNDTRTSENRLMGSVPLWSLVFGLALIAAAVVATVSMVRLKPKAERKPRPRVAPIVETMPLTPTNAEVCIEGMGTVIAVDEAAIQADVSGPIVWVHPELVEGGVVTGGTALVRIDRRDYAFALERQQAALKSAEADLRLEQGRQDIAAREWDLVNAEEAGAHFNRDLALRKPQLEKAKAAVESARAATAQAQLSLDRTEIQAPFDAVIISALADVGDRASPGTVLARLVSTEVFHVRGSVRADQLKWLRFAQDGTEASLAAIRGSDGETHVGTLEKLIPEVETSGRTAQVLVSVADPLSATGPRRPLLLGELVRMDIHGRQIDGVIEVPRAALRDGANVFLLTLERTLAIRRGNALWARGDVVFLENTFAAGTRLIVSSVGTPVEGMSLSDAGSKRGPSEETSPDGPPAAGVRDTP